MQSFKGVSNLILKEFGLKSPEVEDSNKFIPIIQQEQGDNNSSFYNIIEAIKTRDETNILKYLSVKDVSVLFEVASQSKDSLFHWACLSGDVEILKLFKKVYDDNTEGKKHSWIELINLKNSLEQSPLHWSCTIENLSTIDFLKKEGADLNATDNKGVTPLIMCCQYGNISCATYLILNGVDISARDKEGDNALHWALYKGYPELARLLIYSGLNPNHKDGFGQTPLHFACLSGNENCVQNLIENDKVEINVYDNNNKTPIMLAAGRRLNKIVDYLKFHIKSRTNKLPIYSKIRNKIFGTSFNSYIPFIFFISCAMLWGNPYYFIVIRPCSINFAYFSNALFVLLQTLMWICFLMASIKDPGFITKNDSHYNSIMNEKKTLDQFKNIRIKDCSNSINKICHSCKSFKPIRARHCRTCDRCVDEMDHHCPYVRNCVGKNNRYWFFLFIMLMNFVTVIVSYLFYVALKIETILIYPAVITIILILIALFLGFTIFFFMLKQAFSNLTLIEAQKWRKYSYLQDEKGRFFNPYNRVPNLINLQDEVKETFIRYDGDVKIECYSCKMTQKEKKHYKNLCNTFGPEMLFPLNFPQCDEYIQRLSAVPIRKQPFNQDPLIQAKTYTYLTSALTLCYRESYDYSKCESTDFCLERNSEEVITVTDKILETYVDLYQSIKSKMWNEIDKVINLKDCTVYSYKSNKDDDPHTLNNQNGINFLFYNQNLKRLLLFSIKIFNFSNEDPLEVEFFKRRSIRSRIFIVK